MRKTRWFIYTVLVGLIPFFARVLIYSVAPAATTGFVIQESDFIALGLVLSITNINELEQQTAVDAVWRTRSLGLSVLMIIFFAVLFAVSAFHALNQSVFDITRIKAAAILLSLVSVLFSYSIYDNLTKTVDLRRVAT
jgi:hypothetical protein